MSETRVLETFQPEEQALLRQAVEVICSVAQQHGVEVVQIYLFGSRARGEGEEESDWDFYVVTSEPMTRAQQRLILQEAKRVLAKMHLPNDILLERYAQFEKFKQLVGHIAHEVGQEGVRLL
ncbi:MAG: nucleotidyltransferase domain-containing protein [Armatimonadetes bacterium]|nr:nucleotidyltransferase domain-containing protein [Armatimonadota bacterium]